MAESYQRLLQEITYLKQRLDSMVVDGPVKEVKGDKIRVILGKDSEGKEILSPWIHTSQMRGGSRERRFYKEGQNVRLFSPTGDIRQAMLTPYAPNEKFKAPDHANDSGQDEEAYQFKNLRMRQKGDTYEIWLDEKDGEEQNQQGGSSSSSSGSSQQNQDKKKEKPKVKFYLNKSGGARISLFKDRQSSGGSGGSGGSQQEDKPEVDFLLHEKNGATVKIGDKVTLKSNGKSVTGIYDKNRFMVSDKGAKLKADTDFAVVTKGGLICSKDWVKGQDPMPDGDSEDS